MTTPSSRPQRPVLTDDQIEKIAAAIVHSGLVAIVAKPFRDEIRLTVESEIAKLRPEAKVYWVRSQRAAQKIIREMLGSEPRASIHGGGGLRIKSVTIDEVGTVTRQVAHLPGIRLMMEADIAAAMEARSRQIATTIERMKKSSDLKMLERQYRRERLRRHANREPGLPAYQTWLANYLTRRFGGVVR